MSASLYYADPDGNQMEFSVDCFGTKEECSDYWSGSAIGDNPVGVEFDPDDITTSDERILCALLYFLVQLAVIDLNPNRHFEDIGNRLCELIWVYLVTTANHCALCRVLNKQKAGAFTAVLIEACEQRANIRRLRSGQHLRNESWVKLALVQHVLQPANTQFIRRAGQLRICYLPEIEILGRAVLLDIVAHISH